MQRHTIAATFTASAADLDKQAIASAADTQATAEGDVGRIGRSRRAYVASEVASEVYVHRSARAQATSENQGRQFFQR